MNDRPMNGLADSMDRLNARFDELEQRLAALDRRIASLEHTSGSASGAAVTSPGAASSPLLPTVPEFQTGGLFPVLGKAMLGIAGAYLLRALAASHIVPEQLIAPFAIAYAALWLAAGARARSAFAATIYTCNSALILAPMLWELTMTFKAQPAWASALALASFAAVGFALTRRTDRAPVLSIANLTTAALCLTLAIVTHVELPFLGVLLLLVAYCEFAQSRQSIAAARALVALAADLGAWMLIYLYRVPVSARPDYPALSAGWLMAPGFLLFAIFAASIVLKSVLRRKSITIFETAQATIAFLLAASGLMYFGPPARAAMLGALCLLLSAAGYAASLALFQGTEDKRNRLVFGAWSGALFLAGSLLVVPESWKTAWLGLAAVACAAAGARLNRVWLALHGAALLVAAAAVSGLLAYAFHALAETPAGTPSLGICVAACCGALCYAVALPRRGEPEPQGVALLFASMAAVGAMALLVEGLTALARLDFSPGAHHLALIRSFTLCAAALALAFSGARWRRPELTQIGYAVVVLEAVKLFTEDLRHGHLGYVAASVCLYAFTLIAIPRVARSNPQQQRAA